MIAKVKENGINIASGRIMISENIVIVMHKTYTKLRIPHISKPR